MTIMLLLQDIVKQYNTHILLQNWMEKVAPSEVMFYGCNTSSSFTGKTEKKTQSSSICKAIG